MLDTTTLNAIEAASAVRPTGCWGQGAATRLIAWPRVGPPVPAGPRTPFMLPSLEQRRREMLMVRRLTTVILVWAAVLLAGCARQMAPEIRMLSDQEAADLWDKAESRERVGEPVVKTVQNGQCTTVITTQVYRLGRSTNLIAACGGGCQVTGPGGPAGCQTSGCFSTGRGCTPLICSGNCTLSHPCKPASNFGVFMQ